MRTDSLPDRSRAAVGRWRLRLREIGAFVACVRYADVFVLEGPPLMGAAFAIDILTPERAAQAVILAAANALLIAHVFSFNDWAGISGDQNDPNKSATVFLVKGVTVGAALAGSGVLLALSLMLFALLPLPSLLLAVAIAALGIAYSHPSLNAKGIPIISSAPHLIGGMVHFLLGSSVFRPVDGRALLIALFFALTFTAGHLNQEVRDHDGDRANGLRTNAVAFGKVPVFLAGLGVFTLAYADLVLLAVLGIVPWMLGLLALALYPLHLGWSMRTLRGELTFERVSRFQARYRLLYAVIGVAMVVTLLVR